MLPFVAAAAMGLAAVSDAQEKRVFYWFVEISHYDDFSSEDVPSAMIFHLDLPTIDRWLELMDFVESGPDSLGYSVFEGPVPPMTSLGDFGHMKVLDDMARNSREVEIHLHFMDYLRAGSVEKWHDSSLVALLGELQDLAKDLTFYEGEDVFEDGKPREMDEPVSFSLYVMRSESARPVQGSQVGMEPSRLFLKMDLTESETPVISREKLLEFRRTIAE